MPEERQSVVDRMQRFILAMAVICAVVLMALVGSRFYQARKDHLATLRANQEFDQMVAAAKAATADPCGPTHMRTVVPSRQSSRDIVLVIGGQMTPNDGIEKALTRVAIDVLRTCTASPGDQSGQ